MRIGRGLFAGLAAMGMGIVLGSPSQAIPVRGGPAIDHPAERVRMAATARTATIVKTAAIDHAAPIDHAANAATIVTTTVVDPDEADDTDGQTIDVTVHSPAMAANMMVRLILPEGWSSTASRTWPVLWLLHGAGQVNLRNEFSGYESWDERGMARRLMRGRRVITVMPEGGRVGWYSDWKAEGSLSPRPRWETFHMVELTDLLATHYRAGSQQAIAGLSMGGFGALSYAGRYPGRFNAAAAFSAPLTMVERPWVAQMSLAAMGIPHNSIWGDPLDLSAAGGRDTWKAHDPYHLGNVLKDIPIYVASGDGDVDLVLLPDEHVHDDPGPVDILESGASRQSREFADHLRGTGNVTRHFYGRGKHVWPYWRRELCRALPMLLGGIRVPANTDTSGCAAWAAANRPALQPTLVRQ